jgi:hypothetical protein
MKQISSLSIIQPSGELIVTGIKNVENREWKTNKRGFIAIHASTKYDRNRFSFFSENFDYEIDPDEVDYGAVIGFAEIIDVIDDQLVTKKTEEWFEGRYGFVLENMIKLKKAVPIRGSMGLWKLKGKDLERCLAQLNSKQRKKVENNFLA